MPDSAKLFKTNVYTEVGNGTIDFAKIWPDAELAGLRHFFVDQRGNFTHDPRRSIPDSAAYVTRVLMKERGSFTFRRCVCAYRTSASSWASSLQLLRDITIPCPNRSRRNLRCAGIVYLRVVRWRACGEARPVKS